MTSRGAQRTGRPRVRWESRVLDFLAYPANILLGALAALILSLAIVTALPAAIALARAFADWTHRGDDAVFTNTFRHFAQVWRRSIWLGVIAFVASVVIAVDVLFLIAALAADSGSLLLVFAAAAVPIALFLALLGLAITASAALAPEAGAKEWARLAFRMVMLLPARTSAVLLVVLLTVTVCVLIPTMAPVMAVAVPVYAAVRLWPSNPELEPGQ